VSNDQLAGLSQNQEPAGGGAWIVGALAQRRRYI
jgi:hypothetical protein